MTRIVQINLDDRSIGFVYRSSHSHQYRFIAASDDFAALDGRHYDHPELAESAAIAHAVSRRRRSRVQTRARRYQSNRGVRG